ncbi:MAG: DUF2279 domain-containing protein [Bacteroidota bacterium]
MNRSKKGIFIFLLILLIANSIIADIGNNSETALFDIFINKTNLFILLFLLGAYFRNKLTKVSAFLLPLKKQSVFLALITSIYLIFSIGLYYSWYSEYMEFKFVLRNDFGQWNHMDKIGHIYTSYLQCFVLFTWSTWFRFTTKSAFWIAIIGSFLFQSTIEVFDGFSQAWGFSITDFISNMTGMVFFIIQQKIFGKQIFTIKLSSILENYAALDVIGDEGTLVSSMVKRNYVFGESQLENYLKDYNAQTYWISINLRSIFKNVTLLPKWLNLAVGYGANNLYGGNVNNWIINGEMFIPDPEMYPRTKQLFLSLDLDFRYIKTKSSIFNYVLYTLNIFRFPLPTLEINEFGRVKFHWLL